MPLKHSRVLLIILSWKGGPWFSSLWERQDLLMHSSEQDEAEVMVRTRSRRVASCLLAVHVSAHRGRQLPSREAVRQLWAQSRWWGRPGIPPTPGWGFSSPSEAFILTQYWQLGCDLGRPVARTHWLNRSWILDFQKPGELINVCGFNLLSLGLHSKTELIRMLT